MLAVVVAGCESKEQKHEREARAAADSFAALRAKGVHDLYNPEMGWKVLVTLTDDSVGLSHPSITDGQVTFAIQNNSSVTRVAEIKGKKDNWKTMPIRPKESVWLATVLDTGSYQIFCPDSSKGTQLACRTVKTMVVTPTKHDTTAAKKR